MGDTVLQLATRPLHYLDVEAKDGGQPGHELPQSSAEFPLGCPLNKKDTLVLQEVLDLPLPVTAAHLAGGLGILILLLPALVP